MKKALEELLQNALERARLGGALKSQSLPPLFFEVPRDPALGDLACPIAFGLAREERRPPRAIAETIVAHLKDAEGILAAAEIAGAGYLNFRFAPRFWQRCLAETENADYGRPTAGMRRRVLVEFVSTNPTGPLHVGHGRGAVIGDVVARLLAAAGHEVTREYYVNDAGRQIETLGRSAFARLLEAYGATAGVPEDGYPGEYLRDLAAERREELLRAIAAEAKLAPPVEAEAADFLRARRELATAVAGQRMAQWLLEQIKADLRALGVEFESFVSERQIHAEGAVTRALAELAARGLVYEADGARWFRSTAFGDGKDRVVERRNGELTYFAGDIGYHRQKIERGFDQLVNVWGADHHGYVKRVAAAIEALGGDPKRLHVILVQLVRLTRGGEPVRMGKRSGEFVTMREVVDEVGVDATRFFYLMRKADSHLDFDLDLAKKQSAENPVFYVQYAHARISSLFRQAATAGLAVPAAPEAHLERLAAPEEQEVVRLIVRFPDVVEEAVEEVEPHRIVFFLIELAGAFHRFYNRHRVMGVDAETGRARLFLVAATQRVLRTGLRLLGVSAPESM